MHDATIQGNFPDDELSQMFTWLVRMGALGLFETHDHGGLHATASEVYALGELSDGGVRTQQELADRLRLEKSTVSRLAAGLEQRGWLVRERDPDNRRFYRLALTKAGQEAARRIGQHLSAHHRDILRHLTQDERKCLARGINGLMRAVNTVRMG